MMTTPTIELLALPAWNSPPKSLDEWRAALAEQGYAPSVKSGGGEVWLEVASIRLRGYVCLEGDHVEAINFEVHDPAPEAALRALDAAAVALGWEIHPDEPEEDDLDED